MQENMDWTAVYSLWLRGAYSCPALLTAPPSVETVRICCDSRHCIHGYDWLEAEEAARQAQHLRQQPMDFLLFVRPPSKGTLHTAAMLASTSDPEELAAIWIAATAHELKPQLPKTLHSLALEMHRTAADFLRKRFPPWQPTMKRLVPAILIPTPVLTAMTGGDAASVMGLIQLNTLLLQSTWRILHYTSQEPS